MPRKNQNKNKRRNRRNRKLKRRNNFRLTTARQFYDLADRTICLIRVCEAFTDDPAQPVLKYTWIGNGLFNPFGTSGNAQPSWFKPWMAMYAKYRILGSSIQLQMTNTTNSDPYEVSVYPTVDSTIVNSVAEAKTQPFNRSRLVGPLSGMSNSTVRNRMVSKKMFGRGVMGDEGFAGDFTSNPANKWYWQVFFQTIIGSNVKPSFIATVSFNVIFYGRLSQGETTPLLAKLWDHKQQTQSPILFVSECKEYKMDEL